MNRPLEILAVNQYFPPDTSATADLWRGLAEVLADRGHRVEVLAGRPSYEPDVRHPWRPRRRESLGEAVTVERVGSSALPRRRPAGRIANYASFLSLAAGRGRLLGRPDVVVAGSDPPLAVLPALLSARGAPVVYWLQDLHPDMAVAAGLVPAGPTTRVWGATHAAAVRRCAGIVCPGERMAERVRDLGSDGPPVQVVPNGAPAPSGPADPAVVEELRVGAAFVAVHAGNLGGAGPWDTLQAAGGMLPADCGILLVGDGIHADRLAASGALRVEPYRPAPELPSVMAAGDLQIVAQRPGMLGLVVPSKLSTALAHGRPVLAVAPEGSEVVRLVRETGCGLVADPADPGDVVERILWARDHPGALDAMGAAAAVAGRGLRRRTQLERVAAVVEQAVADKAVAGDAPTGEAGTGAVTGPRAAGGAGGRP